MAAAPSVLIVGAGPSGLVAALGLATYGVDFRLVDEKREPSGNSRAVGIQPRSLEVFEQLGMVDEILRRGRRAAGIDLHTPTGVLRIDVFRALAGDTAYPFAVMLEQSETERVLRDRLRSLGHDVEWGVRVAELEPATDAVDVGLVHGDGRSEHVRPRWIVAADGAGSFVREAAGVPFAGTTYEQRFVVADVDAVEGRVDPSHVSLNLNRWGFVLLLPLAGGRYRLVTGFPPGFDDGAREPAFADVQRAVADVFPGGLRIAGPRWFSIFRIASRRVERFRHARICFVGDAAHVHSPVGAQGMNTGVQDAHALAWRLALVVGGTLAPSALDAYDAERGPVASTLLTTTDRVFRLVDRREPWAAALRTWVYPYVVKTLASVPAVRRRIGRAVAQLAIRYRAGSMVGDDGAGFPPGAPAAGERFPSIELRRGDLGTSVAAVADYGAHHVFLIATPDARAQAAELRAALAAALDSLVRVHVVGRNLHVRSADRDELTCTFETLSRLVRGSGAAYLVRPDLYVALRRPRIDSTVVDAVLRYFGRSAPPAEAAADVHVVRAHAGGP